MTAFDPGTRFQRNPGLAWTDMDGETVMMNVERGEYIGIGGAGSFIWECLADPSTIEQICARLTAEFEVDTTTCQVDVSAFLERLLENDVVHQC